MRRRVQETSIESPLRSVTTAFFQGFDEPGRPNVRRALLGMLTMLTYTTLTENSVSIA